MCKLSFGTNFVVIEFVSRVAMETVRFHIAQMMFFLKFFFFFFFHLGVPVNNLAPMRNCPGGCKVG